MRDLQALKIPHPPLRVPLPKGNNILGSPEAKGKLKSDESGDLKTEITKS